jgi:hypothetical protein
MDLIALSRALRRLKSDQRGMTLAELLSAQLVAGVVLAAAGILVISSLNSEQRISDRVNSVSQGRIVAAQLEQRLNSQICLYTGEYKVNGATANTAAASLLHATPNSMIYFADISERASGATTGVGFKPYLRYLMAPTANAGRNGTFVDAYRAPSNSAVPFDFGITPATSLDALAAANAVTTVAPNGVLHHVGLGVSNAVGSDGTTRLPFIQYWDADNLGPTGTPIAMVAGAIPETQLNTVARIRLNYRVLAASGKDQITGSTGGSRLDNRTESFTSDIYLRTTPDICDQLGT